MGEEEDLIEEVENYAIQVGKAIEEASFLLEYDEMVELAIGTIMNEIRISKEGKHTCVINASFQFE